MKSWDGSTWDLQEAPGQSNYVSDVSCAGGECVAVGSGGDTGFYAFAFHSGYTQELDTSGAGYGTLNGVSCWDAYGCMAVGNSKAASWDSSSWASESMPSGYWQDVSCTSSSNCVAVGVESSALKVAKWNGSSWSVQSAPTPAGAVSSQLTGVSCSAANSCSAVGYKKPTSTTFAPLALAWDGSTWSIKSTPGTAILDGVSCTSSTHCTAVGDSGTVLVYDGSSWTTQTTTGGPTGMLYGVSCLSSTFCIDVGTDNTGNRPTAGRYS